MENLKPCPVCNGDVRIEFEYDHYYITCKNFGCGAICIDSDDNDDCISQWNALPRRLRWTKERPTTCDFYWYRSEGGSIEIGIVYADVIGNLCIHFAGEEDPHLLELVVGEWAGPIPEPE